MHYYAGPMEGITGYVYRNAHHRFFRGCDRYFMPFISPGIKRGLRTREKNDVLPAHNEGIPVIPQILTRRAEDFIRMTEQLSDLGYEEVNLNLGCPVRTVVSKGKGSGFLADPEGLQRFLEEIFDRSRTRISVKTRLGMEKPDEIVRLAEIYADYPMTELIIHARVQKDYYRRPANREAFREALSICRHPVCYNGDLFSPEDQKDFEKDFPGVSRFMYARGLIRNPQLIEMIREGTGRDLDRWRAFLAEVQAGYEEIMSGQTNVLFKMKEIWTYMDDAFTVGKKTAKAIRKAKTLADYEAAVDRVFREEAYGI